MQVPLTKADFKKNSITRIARSLMKLYPEGHKIFLSRAKLLVVKALGYESIYEAEIRALESSKMISGEYNLLDSLQKVSAIVSKFTGVSFDGSSLPLHMLDAFRIKHTELDPKIWYRIEKKFCDSLLGVEGENGFQSGKLYEFLADNMDLNNIKSQDLLLPVSEAIFDFGGLDTTSMSDKFVGMGYELLNTIVDNDEARGLDETDRMRLFKSFFERHFIATISQTLGSIYADSPHNWCELYWYAANDHNGHLWKHVSIQDGAELTFKIYRFDNSCDSLEGYNWVCSMADTTDDPDAMPVIRSLVRGSVLKKKKKSIVFNEFDLISLSCGESDQTTALLFGLMGKLKLRRLSELSTGSLKFDIGSYASDESYLDAAFSGPTTVVVEVIAVKSHEHNSLASNAINFAVEAILEKFGPELSVYLGSSQVEAQDFRPLNVPPGVHEFQVERHNLLLNSMSESNNNHGVSFFDVSPIGYKSQMT